MTALNFTLTSTLKTQLAQPGVNAYAVYFDPTNNNKATFTNMVLNGVVQGTGSYGINLPTTWAGGKAYLLIQSLDPATIVAANDLTKVITTQSAIDWNNATSLDYKYDSVEFTLSGGPNDAGNLTAVNGFGLPLELSVPYTDGTTATAGFNVPG